MTAQDIQTMQESHRHNTMHANTTESIKSHHKTYKHISRHKYGIQTQHKANTSTQGIHTQHKTYKTTQGIHT